MLTDRANVKIEDVETELAELEADYRIRGKRLRALLAVLKAEQPAEAPDAE